MTKPKSILSISKLINLEVEVYSQNNSLYKPTFSFDSVLTLKKSAFILVFSVIDLIEEFDLFNLLIGDSTKEKEFGLAFFLTILFIK